MASLACGAEDDMRWKNLLRITAVTLLPGGVILLGGWLVVRMVGTRLSGAKDGPIDKVHQLQP